MYFGTDMIKIFITVFLTYATIKVLLILFSMFMGKYGTINAPADYELTEEEKKKIEKMTTKFVNKLIKIDSARTRIKEITKEEKNVNINDSKRKN